MAVNISEYFAEANRTVHKGRFFGEIKFDPVHSGNRGFMFLATDILQSSVSVIHKVSSETDITIGGVFLGQLSLTMLPSATEGRTATNYWTQAMISLYYEEETGHGSSYSGETGWESFKVGDYYIKDAVFQNQLLYLTAYDGLCLFDLPVETSEDGKFYDMIDRAVGHAQSLFDISIKNGIEDRSLFENFYPNASLTYSIFKENDIRTYRDLLYWIAVSIGGFFYVDRNGYLKVFSYKNDYEEKEYPDCTVDYDERIAGSSQVVDFISSWDGILVTDLVTEEVVQYTRGASDKMMSLGAIPFFQNLSEQQKSSFLTELGEVVCQDLRIRPYKVDLLSAPIYDVGDKIRFLRGDFTPWVDSNNEVISIIHSWSFSKSMLTLKAFGARRATIYVKDSGGGGSASGGGGIGSNKKIDYFYYENEDTLTLDTVDQIIELGSIDFFAQQQTVIDMVAQLNPTHQGTGSWEVFYYWELDSVSDYAAISSGNEYSQPRSIETLTHIKEVLTPGSHTLKLKAKLLSKSGIAEIEYPMNTGVHLILKGQGLEHQNVWNGIISLSESWTQVRLELKENPLEDSDLDFVYITPNKETFSEVQPEVGLSLRIYGQQDDGVTITIEDP